MRRNTDLAVTAAVTVAAALVTGLIAGGGPGIAWLRVLAGVPLVLALPGYALTAFGLPGRSPRGFSPLLWRGLWTVGLSLAVAVLGGLVLNLTPAGLTRVSWAILLAGVTILALAVTAWLRTRSLRTSSPRSSSPRSGRGWRPTRPTGVAAGYAVAALALAGGATWLAVASGGWQQTPAFAQLWLVPGTTTTGTATLGVRSAYPDARAFRLVLKNGTRQEGAWDFTLTPGQTWRRTIPAPAGQRLTAELSGVGRTETVAITPGGTA
jgi:Protein of unknown function (DUF1616)